MATVCAASRIISSKMPLNPITELFEGTNIELLSTEFVRRGIVSWDEYERIMSIRHLERSTRVKYLLRLICKSVVDYNAFETLVEVLGGYGGKLGSLRELLTKAVHVIKEGKIELMETFSKGDTLSSFARLNASLEQPSAATKKTRCALEIASQSRDMLVPEGKATLLEVQINDTSCESYQWSKNGVPLLEGSDFSGVCSDMLYISKASPRTEGKYYCTVSRGNEFICSSKISINVIYPLEKKELLKMYSLVSDKECQVSWPPVSSSTFVDLALIQQKPISAHEYHTVCGNMNDTLESKKAVSYEDVFKEYREGALVLVEGRPGSGKTTLVHKISRNWATEQTVLQGARLVFLLSPRLLNISREVRSLVDLLQAFYGKGPSKTIGHNIEKYKGKGVCFILDGLDEHLSETNPNSIIYKLLYSVTYLPFCMIVVTSRPIAADELKRICTDRIEVLGFSKDQLFRYVETYPFGDFSASKVGQIHKVLSQHPNVLHMCCLPVHAAMICFLFTQTESLPHTETEMYEQFTIATILRYLGKKEQVKSLRDLRGETKESFISLCRLAFNMTTNFHHVVSKREVEDAVSNGSTLGLLTIDYTVAFYRSGTVYTFLHPTLQDFLAAYHISQVNASYKKLVPNILKFCCGLGWSSTSVNVTEIFKFYSLDFLFKVQCAFESQQVELCDLAVRGGIYIKDKVVSSLDFAALGYVVSKTTKLVEKMALIDCIWDIEGVSMFASFVNQDRLKSIKSLKASVHGIEVFVALNNLLGHLPFLEELNLFGSTLNNSRIESLTSTITLPHLKVLKFTLPLVPCSTPEIIFKLLTFGSKSLKKVLFSIHENQAVNYKVWRNMMHCVFNCQVVENSDCSWVHLYNDDRISPYLESNISSCIEVVLVNCCIGDKEAEILANALNTAVLENLVLDFNRIRDSGAIALASCLAKCSVVQQVSIQCNSIGDSGAAALTDALVHCSSLRKLDLQGNILGDVGAETIAKATESLPGLNLYLHNLNITEEMIGRLTHKGRLHHIRSMVFTSSWNSVSEIDIDSLIRATCCGNLPALKLTPANVYIIERIATQQKLKAVRGLECDFNFKVTDASVSTLCNIIKNLPGLQHLKCYVGVLSSMAARLLNDSLNALTSLRDLRLCLNGSQSIYKERIWLGLFDHRECFTKLHSLDLSGGCISSDVIDLLLKNCASLHTLKLFNNIIASDSAQDLGQILSECRNLHCLDICCNDIADSGAVAIAEGLKGLGSLQELRIGCNNISSCGITAFNHIANWNCLRHLDVSDCRIDLSDVPIFEAIACEFLQVLNLGNISFLSSDHISSMSTKLQHLSQLQELHINNNYISSDDFVNLASSLQKCTKLRLLDLGANKISSDGVLALVGIMNNCRFLQELDFIHSAIYVDDLAVLISEWQHKNILTLKLCDCCGLSDHKSAMVDGEECCSSCDHMLELYYKSNYITIFLYGIYDTFCLPKSICGEKC